MLDSTELLKTAVHVEEWFASLKSHKKIVAKQEKYALAA